jgi:hypothetical protein
LPSSEVIPGLIFFIRVSGPSDPGPNVMQKTKTSSYRVQTTAHATPLDLTSYTTREHITNSISKLARHR